MHNSKFNSRYRILNSKFKIMTTAVLSYFRAQKRIKSTVGSISLPSINWKIICIAGFLISLSLLIYYVWQVNYLTRGSYLVNSYEQQVNKLSEEKKNLEVSFAENSFLGRVQQKIQVLNFQKTTSVKYIQVLDNSLTAKK